MGFFDNKDEYGEDKERGGFGGLGIGNPKSYGGGQDNTTSPGFGRGYDGRGEGYLDRIAGGGRKLAARGVDLFTVNNPITLGVNVLSKMITGKSLGTHVVGWATDAYSRAVESGVPPDQAAIAVARQVPGATQSDVRQISDQFVSNNQRSPSGGGFLDRIAGTQPPGAGPSLTSPPAVGTPAAGTGSAGFLDMFAGLPGGEAVGRTYQAPAPWEEGTRQVWDEYVDRVYGGEGDNLLNPAYQVSIGGQSVDIVPRRNLDIIKELGGRATDMQRMRHMIPSMYTTGHVEEKDESMWEKGSDALDWLKVFDGIGDLFG